MLARIVSMLTKFSRRSHEVRENSGTYGNFDNDNDNDNDDAYIIKGCLTNR